jgi:hypothetical protein
LSLSSFTHRNSKSPIATHDKIQKWTINTGENIKTNLEHLKIMK